MNGKLTTPQIKRIDYKHYARLLLEKKYWIILITVVFSAAWFKVVPDFLAAEKKYEFTAIIRFEDPRIRARIGTIDDRLTQVETESRTKIIQTTEFLTKVIDSLNLNILSKTPFVSRSQIFSKIELSPKPEYGSYVIKKKDGELRLFYTNKKKGKKNFLVQAVPIGEDSIISFNANGLHLDVRANLFAKRNEVEFECIQDMFVISMLRENLKLKLNPRQTLFNISLLFNDPYLGAQIVNTIADLFLKESLESKRFRTRNLLASLTEQLKSSKAELERADNALRSFRERNPHIYLTEDLNEVNRLVTTDEMERDQIRKNLERLEQLTNELKSAKTTIDRDLIYQEILSFLQELHIPGITALGQQYQNVLSQKEQLVNQNYSETNPKMVEINNTLQGLQKKIDERVKEFRNEQTKQYDQLTEKINLAEHRLAQSPRQEIELARLQRDREAKAQIYSNLLVRYSEAKVAYVSITPDAELLQKAEVPLMVPDLKEMIKKILIISFGPLVGLILSLTLFIGFDFVKHRARSEQDIELQLNLPVLASIPIILSEKEIVGDFDKGRRMDPKLVTIDFTPHPASNAFRDLRTKLVLGHETEQQSIIFSSLLPGEGKSLVVSNMAVTFAQLKKPTLLIDADLRRGVQHNTFICKKKPGLSDILAKPEPITVEMLGNFIQKTTIPNLHLLSCGKEVPNPTEILMDERMAELYKFIKNRFQYIVFDTPPLGIIPDALVLDEIVHNLVLVTRYGKTDIRKLKKQLKEFEPKNDLRGVILNAIKEQKKKTNYGYSYYKY